MSETTLLRTLAAHEDEMDGDWTPLRQIAGWLGWSTSEQLAYLDVLQTMLECAPFSVRCASAHGGPVADSGELRARTRQLLARAPDVPAAAGDLHEEAGPPTSPRPTTTRASWPQPRVAASSTSGDQIPNGAA